MGVNLHPGWNNRYSLFRTEGEDWFQRHFPSAGKFQLHPLKSRSYGKRWRIGDTFQPYLLQRTMVSQVNQISTRSIIGASVLSWQKTICALDFQNFFSLDGSQENFMQYLQICRERKFTTRWRNGWRPGQNAMPGNNKNSTWIPFEKSDKTNPMW